jgi:hypothetical protein
MGFFFFSFHLIKKGGSGLNNNFFSFNFVFFNRFRSFLRLQINLLSFIRCLLDVFRCKIDF